MLNLTIALGAINALIAVAAGAFAAHGLKNTLSPEDLDTFKTSADYQMIHGIGLILIGLLNKCDLKHDSKRSNNISAWLMLAGIILFSGSLYLLTLSGVRWLGVITPFGGICFLLAWLSLALSHMPTRHQS